jgi:hypothetical protein
MQAADRRCVGVVRACATSSKYIAFIIKSSKRATFNMTPSTIRKIKLGNVALFIRAVHQLVSTHAVVRAGVRGRRPRAAPRAHQDRALLLRALPYPALYGVTANFFFSVVKASFLAFLATAERMTASTASFPTLPQGAGVGAGAGHEWAPRRTSMSMSALSFMRKQSVPNDGPGSFANASSRQLSKQEPKNQTVQRIKGQLSAINYNMIGIPIVTGTMLVLVGASACSDFITSSPTSMAPHSSSLPPRFGGHSWSGPRS